MKILVKLAIGSLAGMALGFLLPQNNQAVLDALTWLEGFIIRLGRYVTLPLMFFSLTIAAYELREDKRLWPLVFRSLFVIVSGAFCVIAGGILVSFLFPPAAIPITLAEQANQTPAATADAALAVFPSNMFSVLAGEGVYLFPAAGAAFFLAMGLSYHDKNYTKPVITLFESFSRVFYYIASFFLEILSLLVIILSAYWAVRFHQAAGTNTPWGLVTLLGVFSAALGFGILPLCLYLVKPKVKNPWAVLYGSLGQAIASFLSGDINFSIPIVLQHVKGNWGVRRRSNMVTVTLFTTFGRAGSAMVAAVAFLVLLRSYSVTAVTASSVLAILGRALVLSFFLARNPGDGAYAALASLCAGFGSTYEAGYLLLKPVAFYLISIGTFLDVMIASFASYALARTNGFLEDKNLTHVI